MFSAVGISGIHAGEDVKKRCFKCEIEKPLNLFHRHARMKDGHLNKCGACTVKDVNEWRKRKGPIVRSMEYERAISRGKRLRSKQIKIDGKFVGRSIEARRKSSLKYAHKRAAKVRRRPDEFTDFVLSEAIDLCQLRANSTGIRWTVDHIVPIHHKDACGLHVAANLQVVPASWNFRKGNRNMDVFSFMNATMGY